MPCLAGTGRRVIAPQAAPVPVAESRGALAAQADALKGLRQQVAQLQGMATHNAKEKALTLQIARRLDQVCIGL